jgi:hypothetical protein
MTLRINPKDPEPMTPRTSYSFDEELSSIVVSPQDDNSSLGDVIDLIRVGVNKIYVITLAEQPSRVGDLIAIIHHLDRLS